MMKKLIVIPFLSLLVSLCLVSCLDNGGGNREVGTFPAVVDYSAKESVHTMRTVAGIFSAPTLLTSDLMLGDCILAQFTLDWDHQPKGDSLPRATEIIHQLIEQSYAQVQNDFDETKLDFDVEEILPIQSLSPQLYNAYLNGKCFFIFGHLAPEKQEMEYTMILKPSDNLTDDTATAYIIAKKIGEAKGSNANIQTIYAIDMLHAIFDLGKESTIRENSVEYTAQELKVKLKYCTGVDDNNAPTYQEYGNGELTFSVFTDK